MRLIEKKWRVFLFLLFLGWMAPDAEAVGPGRPSARRFSFPSSHLTRNVSAAASRPKMAPIPNMGILYAPNSPRTIFMVNKVWYYYYNEKWYKSRSHDGSWEYVPYSKVPDKLRQLPDDYLKKDPSLKEPVPRRKQIRSAKKKK